MRLGVFLCFFFFSADGSLAEEEATEEAEEKEDSEMGPVLAGVCAGLLALGGCCAEDCGCCIDDSDEDGMADVDGDVDDELLLGNADKVSALGLSFLCSNIF